jgi:hypothetical protein
MAQRLTIPEIESWFAARLAELHQREQVAWQEYLDTLRPCGDANLYEQTEPLAWRRLRRTLASLAHDRRRDEFERDRALAEAHGLRLAS